MRFPASYTGLPSRQLLHLRWMKDGIQPSGTDFMGFFLQETFATRVYFGSRVLDLFFALSTFLFFSLFVVCCYYLYSVCRWKFLVAHLISRLYCFHDAKYLIFADCSIVLGIRTTCRFQLAVVELSLSSV